MLTPSQWLDHGALGAAMLTLLIAIGVLYRVLLFVREVLGLVLLRFQENTAALVQLAERLHSVKEED